MDKLKYIKFEESQGQYTNSIPIGVDSKNVDLKTGYNLEETLGDYDLTEGTIEDRFKKIKISTTYETVIDMINDFTLKNGDIAKTLGYHAINDGGASTYEIVANEPDTYYQKLNNGLFAKIIMYGKNPLEDSYRYNLERYPTFYTNRRIKEGVTYYSEDNIHILLQGSAYNPNNNHFYFIAASRDYSSCKIIEVDHSNFRKIKDATFTNLGHGNDIAYNSRINALAVINGNQIILIDANTLQQINTYTIEESKSSIDYDPENNEYYLHAGRDSFIVVDAETYKIKRRMTTSFSTYFDYKWAENQGGILYKNYFIRIFQKIPTTEDNSKIGYEYNYLVFFNKYTGNTDYVIKFFGDDLGTEFESGWVVNNNIELLAGSTYITLMTVFIDTKQLDYERPTYYYGSTRLLPNSNLNNRIINGHYVTLSNDDTKNIYNLPNYIEGQISTDIRQHGFNGVSQTVIDQLGEEAIRTYHNKEWIDWIRLLTSKNVTIEKNNSWTIVKIDPLKFFIAFYNSSVAFDGTQVTANGNMYYTDPIKIPFQFASKIKSGYSAVGSCGTAGLFFSNFSINQEDGSYYLSVRINLSRTLSPTASTLSKIIVVGEYT